MINQRSNVVVVSGVVKIPGHRSGYLAAHQSVATLKNNLITKLITTAYCLRFVTNRCFAHGHPSVRFILLHIKHPVAGWIAGIHNNPPSNNS
jgi:ABC-type iron transport system FetAB permease component